MPDGRELIELAKTKIGQEYKFGAQVPFSNRDWPGPWDCAEFITWAVFQVCGKIYGAREASYHPAGYDAWTGHWEADRKAGTFKEIEVSEAFAVPGAILLRAPNTGDIKIGHIAFSTGQAETVEAHSTKVGVVTRSAQDRYWRSGLLLPEFTYTRTTGDYWYRYPRKYWRLTSPYTFGKEVMKIKQKLASKGHTPGLETNAFDQATHDAVAAFQQEQGLVVDGIVGKDTLRALGFMFGPAAQT